MTLTDQISFSALIVSGASLIASIYSIKISRDTARETIAKAAAKSLDQSKIDNLRNAAHAVEHYKPASNIFQVYKETGGFGDEKLHRRAHIDFNYAPAIRQIISENKLSLAGQELALFEEAIAPLIEMDETYVFFFQNDSDDAEGYIKRIRGAVRVQEENCKRVATMLRDRASHLEYDVRR